MTNKKQFGVIEANDVNDIIYNGGKPCYMGGIRVPYMPKPNDCWSNPYDEYKNGRVKANAWRIACENNEMAVNSKNEMHPVKNFKIEDMAFVAGLWRIQEKVPYKITRVRDKDMILMDKINHVENTLFEFWNAKEVVYNCYGICLGYKEPDFIVAKYDTDKGTYLGYGRTLEAARAFLGLKLYDEYKDVINAIACKNKLKHK